MHEVPLPYVGCMSLVDCSTQRTRSQGKIKKLRSGIIRLSHGRRLRTGTPGLRVHGMNLCIAMVSIKPIFPSKAVADLRPQTRPDMW